MANRSRPNPRSSEEYYGHASDRGRVYQQSTGQQFNVEQAYFGAEQGLLPWRLDPQELPKARELDPLELGIHRAPIQQGNAIPQYISRDIDDELLSQLASAKRRGGLVFIVGDSTAGKSRSLYEAMLQVLPNYRILNPDDGADIRRSLVALVGSREPCAVWLDDMERYLGPNGLTPGILTQLRVARVVVLGTLRAEEYRKLTQFEGRGPNAEHNHEITAIGHLLNQAEPIVLQRRWSDSEIERTSRIEDPRLKDALKYSDIYGVAEYLAAGPELLRELRLAWQAGANPRGAALVMAAVDCVRAGIRDPLPLTLLDSAHHYYLNDAGGALLRPEPLESALKWATRRRYGVTSLLLPSAAPGCYRVFDYIPDAVSRDPDANAVPHELWSLALEFAREDPTRLFGLALAAASAAENRIAEDAWTQLADAGNNDAAIALVRLLGRLSRFEEAENRARQTAENGGVEAAVQLGVMFEEQSRDDDAERWYRAAAEQNNNHGVFHLATLLRRRGQFDEAEFQYRKLASDPENKTAPLGLGRLLTEIGQLEEAESWLRKAVEDDVRGATNSLGVVLAETDRADEAKALWRKAAKASDEYAMANLGNQLHEEGELKEAETWFRRAIEGGKRDAALRLAIVLEETGRAKEAEKVLNDAVSAGVNHAAHSMAILFARSRRISEAAIWARKAVESGEREAAGLLASLLDDLDQLDEAETWYRQAAEDGDIQAAERIAALHLERRDYEEAERWVRPGAESGHLESMCTLGAIDAAQSKLEEAEQWLRKASDGGHSHAGCLLGNIFVFLNRLDEAEEAYRAAFDGGHKHAAERLVRLMTKQGRGKDAAEWHSRTVGSGYRRASPRGNVPRKKQGKKRRPRR